MNDHADATSPSFFSTPRPLDLSTPRRPGSRSPSPRQQAASPGCDEGGAEAETRGQERAGERPDEAATAEIAAVRPKMAPRRSTGVRWAISALAEGMGARGDTHQPLQQRELPGSRTTAIGR